MAISALYVAASWLLSPSQENLGLGVQDVSPFHQAQCDNAELFTAESSGGIWSEGGSTVEYVAGYTWNIRKLKAVLLFDIIFFFSSEPERTPIVICC